MDFNSALMGYAGVPNINNFNSKAEAIKFAIEFTASPGVSARTPNYEAAQELYDFICNNVNLPDVRPNLADGLVEFAKNYIEQLAEGRKCNKAASDEA